MNIELNNTYCITSDKKNLILQEKKYPDPNNKFTKDPNEWKWIDVGYYGKVEHLANALIEREIKYSHATDLQELVALVENATREICERLEGVK